VQSILKIWKEIDPSHIYNNVDFDWIWLILICDIITIREPPPSNYAKIYFKFMKRDIIVDQNRELEFFLSINK